MAAEDQPFEVPIREQEAEPTAWSSQRQLWLTLEAAGAGTWDWDMRTNRVQWSANLEALHGMQPGSFDGTLEGVLRLIDPDDRERFRQTISRSTEKGGEFRVEYRSTSGADGPRWFEGRGRVLFENGQPAHLIGICTDISRRKRAEQELVESENRYRRSSERYRQVTEAMPAAMSRCSRDLRYVWVNKTYADWLGRPPNEIVGRPLAEVLGPEQFDRLLPQFQAVLSGQEVQHEEQVEFPLLGRRWISTVYRPTFDAAGVPDGWVAVVIDIEGRKQAEQAVARRAAQQAAVAALGQRALTNPDLLGYMDEAVHTVAAALGVEYSTLLELLPGEHQLLLRAGVGWRAGLVGQATLSTGRDSQAGYVLLTKRSVVVEDLAAETRFRAAPLLREHGVVSGMSCLIAGPAGQPQGVLGAHTSRPRRFTSQDLHFLESVANLLGSVIQRKHVQEALQQSERRLWAVVQTAADAILTIDEHGIIDSANPAAERMFGYRVGELIGQNVRLLMPPPDREEHDGYLARYLATGEKHIIGIGKEVEAQRKDGTVFPVDLAVSEVEPGKRFTGILRDISRRKELEREVVEIASLEQKRIGQDLHDTVSQELTALNLRVADLAETLRTDPAQASSLVERIAQGVRRCQQQVRIVSRGLYPVDVDTEGLMAALADLAASSQRNGNVSCTFDCPEPVAVADNLTATHLYLIAQEAVHNALKHAQPRNIRISLRLTPRLVLRVRDDGRGFASAPPAHGGLGLRIMHNRASIIGAALTVVPARPSGTLVTCAMVRRNKHERGAEAAAGSGPDRR